MREVLREERLLLCNMLMSYVSDEEQKEIDTSFGSPQDYENEELINMTEWLKNDP